LLHIVLNVQLDDDRPGRMFGRTRRRRTHAMWVWLRWIAARISMSRKIWSGFARRTLLLGTRKTEPLPRPLDGKRHLAAEALARVRRQPAKARISRRRYSARGRRKTEQVEAEPRRCAPRSRISNVLLGAPPATKNWGSSRDVRRRESKPQISNPIIETQKSEIDRLGAITVSEAILDEPDACMTLRTAM